MPYDELEKSLLKHIKATLKPYVIDMSIDEINQILIEKGRQIEKEKNNDILNLIKERDKCVQKISLFMDKRMDSKIDEDTFNELIKEQDNKIVMFTNKIKELQSKRNKSNDQIEKVSDYKEKIKELLDLKNPTRDLMFALIDRIEIDKDRSIEITYKFNLIYNDDYKYD